MSSSPPNHSRTLLLVIVLGLCAWGIFHTVGAYGNNWRRSALVAGCFAAFLGFWGAMLWMREARIQREAARSLREIADPPEAENAAWDAEIARRVDEIKSGSVPTIGADEAHRKLHDRE